MKRLDTLAPYKRFIDDRDRALEQFHVLAQQRQSDLLRAVLSSAGFVIRQNYPLLIDPTKPYAIDQLTQQLDSIFSFPVGELAKVVYRLRKASYTLAYAGETEALARVMPNRLNNTLKTHAVKAHSARPSMLGGPVENRIKMYLDRMKRKLISAVQLAAMAQDNDGQPLSLNNFMTRVFQAMPQSRTVKQPRRALRRLTESTKPVTVDAAIDLIDDDTWQAMVDDYREEFFPRWRGPESTVSDLATPTRKAAGIAQSADEWYSWELERDLTHELVSSVRNGEWDAGQTAGITDFVWVAVVDKSTCDDCCDGSGCVDRDGLTTKEIEEKFGEPINPPAHFNCRCRLVPALESLPEKVEVDYKSFNDWLDS